MINILKESKIVLTNKPFDIMKEAIKEKAIALTPLTPISKIINFTKKGFLNLIFRNKNLQEAGLIDENNISEFNNLINEYLGLNYLECDFDLEKITKTVFKVDPNVLITKRNLLRLLEIIDELAEDKITIYLFGFEDLNLPIYSSIVVITLVQTLTNKNISWENLEDLIISRDDDWFEVHDKDKLLSWLEMRTGTVLSLGDLDNYFKGEMSMNTFLIERAFRAL